MRLYAKTKTAHGYEMDDFDNPLDPTPARESAVRLSQALLGLMDANNALSNEKAKIRKDHREMDYDPFGVDAADWSEEQEALNRAMDAFEDAMTEVVERTMSEGL